MAIQKEKTLTVPHDHFIKVDTQGEKSTIRNLSGHIVGCAIAYTDSDTLEESEKNDLTLIGGVVVEFTTPHNGSTWLKSMDGVDATVLIRPHSLTADLPQELYDVSDEVDRLVQKINDHVSDKDNPHEVTDDQTNKEKLPNATSNDIESNDSQVLSTTQLTHAIVDLIRQHVNSTGNVHDMTKDEIGLSQVPNYHGVRPDEYHKTTVNNAIVTPQALHTVLDKRLKEVTINALIPVHPMCVLNGKQGDYAVDPQVMHMVQQPVDWGTLHVSHKPLTLEYSDMSLTVKSGLEVSYVYDTEICRSLILDHDIHVNLPVVDLSEGLYTLYVLMDDLGYIVGTDYTPVSLRKVHEPYINTGYSGYTWSTTEMNVYDTHGVISKACPIGTFYIATIQDGVRLHKAVTYVNAYPIGHKYTQIVKLTNGVHTYHPAFDDIDVKCELNVLYNGMQVHAPYTDTVGAYADVTVDSSSGHTSLGITVGSHGILKSGYGIAQIDAQQSPVRGPLPGVLTLTKSL